MYAINSKIFFLGDVLFLKGHLRFFLGIRVLFSGSYLIRVILHSGKYGIKKTQRLH